MTQQNKKMQTTTLLLVLAHVIFVTAVKVTNYAVADFMIQPHIIDYTNHVFDVAHQDSYELVTGTGRSRPANAVIIGYDISQVPHDATIKSALLYFGTPANGGSNLNYLVLSSDALQLNIEVTDQPNFNASTLLKINNNLVPPQSQNMYNFTAPVPIDMTAQYRMSIEGGYKQFKISASHYTTDSVVLNSHTKQSDSSYVIVDYEVPSTSTQSVTTTSTPSVPIATTIAPQATTQLPTSTQSTTKPLSPTSAP